MSVLLPKFTIDQALAEFLAEQQERLTPRVFENYESVIHHLKHCLNEYAYEGLEHDWERKRFELTYEHDRRAFVRLFGPEHIAAHRGSFEYFMETKVIDSKAVMKAAGSVMDKLIAWLHERGQADVDHPAPAALPPVVLPEPDSALDRYLQSLPELRGAPEERDEAAELRAGLIRWTGAIPARQVQLVVASLRDARWWIDHRNELFTEVGRRLGPHAHLLGDTSEPEWPSMRSERLIYSAVQPEAALYPTEDAATDLFLSRVRQGLVLCQSTGQDNGKTTYVRLLKYAPPDEDRLRFAVVREDFEDPYLMDFPDEDGARGLYDFEVRERGSFYLDRTDVPTARGLVFTPFQPCGGTVLEW